MPDRLVGAWYNSIPMNNAAQYDNSIQLRRAGRLLACVLACVALGAVLAGCGSFQRQPAAAQPAQTGQGGLTPESVTKAFFDDLSLALKDPALVNQDVRARWVERLSGYFAPNEREAQRVILNDALASFAEDRAQLGDDEALSLEIHFDEPRRIAEQGDQALVLLPNASIFMQISRITDRGAIPYYEQPISLDRVTGRTDGSVPTIRVGNRWFLTEG